MGKLPRKFFEPLAIGAPQPYREPPVALERMIHFFPPQNEKLRALCRQAVQDIRRILVAFPADLRR